MICKPWKEGAKEGDVRIMRRGGRVSNTVKTLEQGDKQRNKILTYFTKFGGGDGMGRERGHPSATEKLCVGVKIGVDVYEYEYIESENDCVGSANK